MTRSNKIALVWIPPLLLFQLNIGFTVAGFYEIFPWFDIPMHLIGGIIIGNSIWLILDLTNQPINITNLLLIPSITSVIAVLWEIYEYTLPYFISSMGWNSLGDTLCDMSLGITGAIVVALAVWTKSEISNAVV